MIVGFMTTWFCGYEADFDCEEAWEIVRGNFVESTYFYLKLKVIG